MTALQPDQSATPPTPLLPGWLTGGLKAAASAALLVWLGLRLDWRAALDALWSVRPEVVLLAVTLAFVSQLLCARRLQVLVGSCKVRVPYPESLRLTFIGVFFGNFLPGTIGGDVYRIVALVQRGCRKSLSLTVIFVDRLVNLAAMIAMISLIWWSRDFLPPGCAAVLGGGVLAFCAILGVALALGRTFRGPLAHESAPDDDAACACGRRTPARHQPRPDSPREPPRRLERFARAAREIFRWWATRPETLLHAFLLSLILIFATQFGLWVFGRSLGMEVDLVTFVVIHAVIACATVLPISLNGLGIQEAGYVYLLAQVGVPPETTVPLALFARFLYVLTGLPGVVLVAVPRVGRPHVPVASPEPVPEALVEPAGSVACRSGCQPARAEGGGPHRKPETRASASPRLSRNP